MILPKKHLILIGVFLSFFIVGIVAWASWHKLFSYAISKRLPLEPQSESYDGWLKIPFPIYQRFYYFNITNPREFLNGTEKANVVQVGPYTWRSEWTKEQVEWSANNTVQYRERRRFWFDREESVGDQDDVITTINAPLVGASQRVKNMSPIVRVVISAILDKLDETLFIKRSIRELTYEGYKDVLAELSHIIDKNMPIKNGKFAYMSGKNDTDEGVFNVFAGNDNIRDMNRIDMWNGRDKLPWWDSNSSCAELKGTNGELRAPIDASDESIDFFTPNFCKPWKLSRDDAAAVESYGIALTRFVAGPEVLFNSSQDPSHKCYEQSDNRLPSGGMDISRCQFGLPLVLSYPHFYAADPEYARNIEGLSPNQSLHQFTMDIEPNLGITLGLKARAQINIKLSRVSFLRAFRNIPEMVLPIFWQEMDIVQTQKFADHLRSLVLHPRLYGEIIFILLTCVAALAILVTIAHIGYLFWCDRQKDRRPLLSHDGNERTLPEEAGNAVDGRKTPPPCYQDSVGPNPE